MVRESEILLERLKSELIPLFARKKRSPRRITSSPLAQADIALICQLDEQWGFVGSKARAHWLWYACNTKNGGV